MLVLTMRILLGLALLPFALGHGDEMEGVYGMDNDGRQYPPTYFTHAEYRGLGFSHIVVMIMAWVFALPVCRFNLTV